MTDDGDGAHVMLGWCCVRLSRWREKERKLHPASLSEKVCRCVCGCLCTRSLSRKKDSLVRTRVPVCSGHRDREASERGRESDDDVRSGLRLTSRTDGQMVPCLRVECQWQVVSCCPSRCLPKNAVGLLAFFASFLVALFPSVLFLYMIW